MGIALLAVLWILALLTAIAGSLVYSVRTETQIAANLVSLSKAEALADAGIHKAAYELLKSTTDPGRWIGNGRTHSLALDEGEILVTIIDESGKIDVNAAADPLLKGLFLSVALTGEQADAIVDAVLDWRDADDLRHLRGAEAEDYLAAGRGYKPANAPFETIEELRQVLGMTDSVFRRIFDLVTVYSRQPGVNTAVAPKEVLLAIPGLDIQQIEAYLAQRQAALDQGLSVPLLAQAQGYAASDNGSVFSVRSEARLADNTAYVRDAVLRLTGNAKQPIAYLAWRMPDAKRQ